MKTKELLKRIYTLAKHQMKVNELWEKINETDFFEDLSFWSISNIYPNCTIKKEGRWELYSADGKCLSRDGRCMIDEIPCFVNQTTGYCGDNFYGKMFIKVDDKNTFVAISYEC